MLFCAVGRTSEVATATWDSARWCNIYHNFVLNWGESKTGDADPMNFWPDYHNFELDFYFHMFLYLSTGGGIAKCTQPIDSVWIFPALAKLTNPSTAISKFIADLMTEIQDYGIFSGKSLRVGSVNEILEHRNCELFHGIIRGGWAFGGYCNIFEYIMKSLRTMSVAGKALAGWPNPREKVHLPRCCFIDSLNIVRVNNLMQYLFQGQVVGMQKDGPLWPLADCILATVLMHLPSFVEKYPNHVALKALKEAGWSYYYM
jgi:hypothetical protein